VASSRPSQYARPTPFGGLERGPFIYGTINFRSRRRARAQWIGVITCHLSNKGAAEGARCSSRRKEGGARLARLSAFARPIDEFERRPVAGVGAGQYSILDWPGRAQSGGGGHLLSWRPQLASKRPKVLHLERNSLLIKRICSCHLPKQTRPQFGASVS